MLFNIKTKVNPRHKAKARTVTPENSKDKLQFIMHKKEISFTACPHTHHPKVEYSYEIFPKCKLKQLLWSTFC